MDIFIKPLDLLTLNQATALRDQIFLQLTKLEQATLASSLESKQTDVHKEMGIDTLDYWVAVKEERVVGLIGLYTEHKDHEDTVWLGWYCVDPSERGMGLGEVLLDYAIAESKKRNYKWLKLYTTTSELYASARRLYVKKGFFDVTSSTKAVTRYFTMAL